MKTVQCTNILIHVIKTFLLRRIIVLSNVTILVFNSCDRCAMKFIHMGGRPCHIPCNVYMEVKFYFHCVDNTSKFITNFHGLTYQQYIDMVIVISHRSFSPNSDIKEMLKCNFQGSWNNVICKAGKKAPKLFHGVPLILAMRNCWNFNSWLLSHVRGKLPCWKASFYTFWHTGQALPCLVAT